MTWKEVKIKHAAERDISDLHKESVCQTTGRLVGKQQLFGLCLPYVHVRYIFI